MSAEPNTFRAMAFMAGAILAFTTMAVAGREVSIDLDTFEIMLYRSVIGFLIVLITAIALKKRPQTQRMGLHTMRNICHFTGQNLWFLAITLIPLAQVIALEFTSPLWVLLLSPLLLGERMTYIKALAALTGFIGVLIIAQPGVAPISFGMIAAALAAIAFAGSIVTTKMLTKTDSLITILFYMTLMQIVMGLICAGWDMDISLPKGASMGWVVLIACMGLMAHVCLTTALKLAPATVVVPMDFLRLPIVAIVGVVLYQENLTLTLIIGAILILIANYLNIWFQPLKRR